jgi:hypothetical protein
LANRCVQKADLRTWRRRVQPQAHRALVGRLDQLTRQEGRERADHDKEGEYPDAADEGIPVETKFHAQAAPYVFWTGNDIRLFLRPGAAFAQAIWVPQYAVTVVSL